MDPVTVRRGRNEAVFRNVNERLEALNETFAELTEVFEIVCECGDSGCAERMRIDAATYRRVRDDAALFIVVPGHEEVALESVVERRDGYSVIRKHPGLPEQIAQAADPES